MKSFTSGMTYLRVEALKVGFILESDNDDVLVERLSQVIRRIGKKEAVGADKATEAGKGAPPGSQAKVQPKAAAKKK